MNDREAQMMIEMLTTVWPTPVMQVPEIEMWRKTLKGCGSRMVAAKVFDDLARDREFRPNIPVFRKAYIAKVQHEQLREEPVAELEPGPGDRLAGPEYTAKWLAICRQQLAEATGPLFKGAGSRVI